MAGYITEDTITKLWGTMTITYPTAMNEWMDCLPRNKTLAAAEPNKEELAKGEVRGTLQNEDIWADRGKNFLLRLISDDEHGYKDLADDYKPLVRLALGFVQQMTNSSQFNNFIFASLRVGGKQEYLNDRNTERAEDKTDDTNQLLEQVKKEQKRGNGLLHMAARVGRCSDLKQFLMTTDSGIDVNAPNNIGETALHLAAEFEHPENVELLLQAGATLQADHHDCTPLHSAAMAINPSPRVAELLVGAVPVTEHWLLNKQSDEDSGSNTALHIAADNVNVTQEFLEKLKAIAMKIRNKSGDTPFHVAAKSSNPKAIIYILNAFAPTRGGWDVDDVDRDRTEPPLINVCARSGNAEAVALLIQHGADISKGVLHEIVIESTKHPEKTDKLLEVYRTIVDNAVTWRCLEENIKLITKRSDQYRAMLRETMTWLITKPSSYQNYGCGNVIERAVECSASAMLLEMLNTENVFRFQRSDNKVTFDVTNFTQVTRLDRDDVAAKSSMSKRNYSCQFEVGDAYLRTLVLNFDDWRDTNILEEQPMRDLTKPYFRIIQSCYFLLGLLQLIFVICFSVAYIPSTCWLGEHFNVAVPVTSCDFNYNRTENSSIGGEVVDQPSHAHPSWFWLVWPVILGAANVSSFFADTFWTSIASLIKYCKAKRFVDTYKVSEPWPTKILLIVSQTLPSLGFSVMVCVWYHRYGSPAKMSAYLEATSMVLLFGWITNFIYFSGTTKTFCVFAMVLKEMIIKDIMLSFLLVFIFTVVAFSFSLHVLRMTELPADDAVFLSDTVYDVFIASLGSGDFVEYARDERHSLGIHFALFEVVLLCYVCMTVIILLNVLIALLNDRYDDARTTASNIWRFQILSVALFLENFPSFRWMIRQMLQDALCVVCYNMCCCCCYCRMKRLKTDDNTHKRRFLTVYM